MNSLVHQTVPRKHLDVAIAIVFDRAHEKLLICRRKADAVLGGYWEFPGGKCEAGEAPEVCVSREVEEETRLKVGITRALKIIEHEYAHAYVRLHPFVCEHVGGDLQLLGVAEAKWVIPAAVRDHRFPEANQGLLEAVAWGYDALLEIPQGD